LRLVSIYRARTGMVESDMVEYEETQSAAASPL
jgi:hypothetical protein